MRLLIQIVYLNQTNSSGVVYTVDNRGVVARLQICNNRRLACRSRSVAAVLNIADLIAGDNPPEYRCLPVIIGSNQCSGPVVQFQSRITQRIGDPKLRELRANGTNDHRLCPSPLNNKTANHHMLARLHEAAGADVAQGDSRRSCDCGLQSVDRNAFLAIARNASNCCDRRAKPVTMPRQRAIAGVYEAVGANYVSGNVSES